MVDDLSGRVILWRTDDGIIDADANMPNPLVRAAGVYIITVTDLSSHCVSIDSVIIEAIQGIPIANIADADTITCIREQISLDATASSQGGMFEAHWQTEDGQFVDSILILQPIINSAGTYILSITNIDNQCTSFDTVIVIADIESPVAIIDVLGGLDCRDSIVILDGTNSQANHNLNYLWTSPKISDSLKAKITINEIGLYQLITEDQFNGCKDTALVTIQEDRTLPQIDLDDLFRLPCPDAEINIATLLTPSDNISIQWTSPNGNILSDPQLADIIINQDGNYIIEVTNQNNYCQAIDSTVVEADSFFVELITKDPSCEGGMGLIQLNRENTTSGNYTLDISDIGIIENFDELNLDPGTYFISLTHESGCGIQDTINILNAPEQNILLKELFEIKLGDVILFNPVFNFDTSAITFFKWTPSNDLLSPNSLTTLAQPTETTDYNLFITIDSLCDLSVDTRVIIARPDIYIPNVFTPNGDGNNDVFSLFSTQEVEQIEQVIIANRWGDIIHNKSNFDITDITKSWDGEYKGVAQSPGVYVYHVRVRFINGTVKDYKGSVTLLR